MGKETLPKRRVRVNRIISLLNKEFPDATCALTHQSAIELLVATILSAQCTDVRVNQVTPGLFLKYRTVKDFAEADRPELEIEIKSTGFYRNKAKNIIQCAQQILVKYQGRVPDTMEELTSLAGVGRKTANVILGSWFQKNEGVVVDTHVERISQLLGLTQNHDPVKVEQDLIEMIAQKDWTIFSHLLILHGRKTCKARRPDCPNCVLQKLCPSSSV